MGAAVALFKATTGILDRAREVIGKIPSNY